MITVKRAANMRFASLQCTFSTFLRIINFLHFGTLLSCANFHRRGEIMPVVLQVASNVGVNIRSC
jgi:hypothetical protein